MRHVRFNSEALEDPYRGLASDEPGLDTARPSMQSSGELIPNVDPARAKWAQKGDLWLMHAQDCHCGPVSLPNRHQSLEEEEEDEVLSALRCRHAVPETCAVTARTCLLL